MHIIRTVYYECIVKGCCQPLHVTYAFWVFWEGKHYIYDRSLLVMLFSLSAVIKNINFKSTVFNHE